MDGMNDLQKNWLQVSEDLNLEMIPDFTLELRSSNGVVVIKTELFVKSFGMLKGMLLITDYDVISAHVCDLIQMGYGFSILNENDDFSDRGACVNLLKDWGWSGDESLRPDWLN